MRPLKIVISAFGPYAKEEVIDFSLLDGKNIFLITGATGAGKTTIFDAISYALFGEASGSSRETDSLRSDFANIIRLTFVELDFELRGEIYHVKRIPQQLKPKVKGEGFTNQSAEAELVLPDGKVRTGAGNVSNKINEILGINKEQFKQIVMLPQGEFKKLLLADSKEREVIFRKIFGTFTYERIQSFLYDKSRELYKGLEKSKDRILVNIKNIKSQEIIIIGEDFEITDVMEKLQNLISETKEKGSEVDKNLKRVKNIIEKLQLEKMQSENNNNLIIEAKKVYEKLTGMLEEKPNIEKKEILLGKANKAKDILYIEEELLRQKRNGENKNLDKNKTEININKLKEELKIAKENLIKEEEKESEKSKFIEEINSLKEKKPKIVEFDKKVENIKRINIKTKDNIQLTKDEEIQIENLKKELKIKETLMKKIIESEKEKIILDKEIKEGTTLIEEVRELYAGIVKLKGSKKIYMDLIEQFKQKEEAYKKCKNDYEIKEEIYMKEQAGILAMELRDSAACPVCGSLEHPHIAKRVEGVPTEEELKTSKKLFEDRQSEYNLLLLDITKSKEGIDTLFKDIIEIKLEKLAKKINCRNEYDDDTDKMIMDMGKELANKLKGLNINLQDISKVIDGKELTNKIIEKIEGELKASEEKLLSLREYYILIFGELKGEEEILKRLEIEVPKEIRSVKELDRKITKLENLVNEYNRILRLTLERVNSLNNSFAFETSKLNEVEKSLNEIKEEIKDKVNLMEEKIKMSGFTNYEEYEDVKGDIKNIEKITNEISFYKEEFKSLSDRNKELAEKTKDIELQEVEKYEEDIKEYRIKEDLIDKEAREIYSIISNNTNIQKEIKGIQQEVQDREEEYKVIGELAALSNGKRSPYITFERFVLASYFQEIIDSANTRLSKMTGERYILKRKEDKGKGTSQQGLELEVYDNYTGKCRHVKTLSGGESFKASLALALGLSDVVQSNAGGISLDTIFIDEGFGTLDAESLENAINSLLELQRGGRLVGIISHVPELKERVETKLEIKASAEGSSAKFSIG